MATEQKIIENEQRFWILVNRAEAHFGLGNMTAYEEAKAQAGAIEHGVWMMQAFTNEVEKLRVLMRHNGHLLPTGWKDV